MKYHEEKKISHMSDSDIALIVFKHYKDSLMVLDRDIELSKLYRSMAVELRAYLMSERKVSYSTLVSEALRTQG